MDNALDFDPAEATEYGKRLNIVPIALFCMWLGSTVMLWLQAFGPLLQQPTWATTTLRP
jgi:hypothetical protein